MGKLARSACSGCVIGQSPGIVDGEKKGKEPLRRSMKFSFDNQPYFRGTYSGSFLLLGYGGAPAAAAARRSGALWRRSSYKDLCQAKTTNFWKITQQLQS